MVLGQGDGGGLCADCFAWVRPHTGVQCHQCATRVEALFSTPGLACGQCADPLPLLVQPRPLFMWGLRGRPFSISNTIITLDLQIS